MNPLEDIPFDVLAAGPNRRVLVCGSRSYSNRKAVFEFLDRQHALLPFSVIIHGAMTGADTFADEWAKARGVPALPFEAEWTRYGNDAGPIRNMQMLMFGQPDVVIMFPGGRGTANMVRQAIDAKVPVITWPTRPEERP